MSEQYLGDGVFVERTSLNDPGVGCVDGIVLTLRNGPLVLAGIHLTHDNVHKLANYIEKNFD